MNDYISEVYNPPSKNSNTVYTRKIDTRKYSYVAISSATTISGEAPSTRIVEVWYSLCKVHD